MHVSWSRSLRAVAAGILGLLLGSPQVSWSQQSADNIENKSDTRGRTAEDWTSLSLAGSDLRPEKPIFGEKDDFPLFTRELIQVKWRKGDPIDLYVIRPKGSARPPVILYLYSYPSETDRFRNDDYCVRLTRDGFAAVGFVSALTGQRYSNRPMKEWFVSELQEVLSSSVHDVHLILNYLGTRDDLDMSKVGMLGAGSGASVAILAAATDQRIKAIDLLDPWGDWPDWMGSSSIIPEAERPSFLKPEFLKRVASLDPVEWLPKLKSQRVRIQHVLDDTVTPKVSKDRIESAAPATATIVKYETTGQFLGAVSGGRLFQWVKDMVQPPSKPQRVAASGQPSPAAVRATEPGHED
jgi:hypothetical protein